MSKVEQLFELELRRRGMAFEIDAESGRYVIDREEGRLLISLDNLAREFSLDGDVGRVSRFVEITVSAMESDETCRIDNVYWALEPSDHVDQSDYLETVSDRVDRVLVHMSADRSRISWVTPAMIETLGSTYEELSERAFENLARELAESTIEVTEIDGVGLGMLGSTLPFKAALILAPNLREIVGKTVGWPLLAVVPVRDFLYLWDARHTEFTSRVGNVVVTEYTEAPYRISPEVFQISDDGIEAIGEFPC